MTTFQALTYAILQGITQFLPVSADAHLRLVPWLLGWPGPNEAFQGLLALGGFISLLLYFRHDWASIISCFLQVIIFRKRPMTLDERLPIFLTLTSLPVALTWYYAAPAVLALEWNPLWVAGSLALFTLPLAVSESRSRKNKGMFDWNWLDALIVGVTQAATVIPGCGNLAASLPGAFFRNFNREAATKYSFLALAPVLLATAIAKLHGIPLSESAGAAEISWLSFSVASLVTILSGLLAIGGFMRQMQRRSLGQYLAYRWIVAAAVAVFYWIRTRG